ncbi:pentatricopeptide repeat-containing protein At4g14050, mitochondrial isoform X2 [Impatiens glandulifera]|uniref:pentatricopeptide repeat-containing protein At4g14050, mitochondrial isoform X2 n=1 Tax=Impatiens glandulifera TaxID=253017 RepID=UPI001FB16B0D|nr:pentatricopeptide repeat-containing protein At4g14050, mitochondrial isoform X2 [Impatiens glandulifera]
MFSSSKCTPSVRRNVPPRFGFMDGLLPDHFIFASLVKACAALGFLRLGKQFHAGFIFSSFSNDDVVKSSLVHLYAKCGVPDLARVVFDSILKKNSISWTSVVSGYARLGRKAEAVELLRGMQENNLFTWTALISGLVQSGHYIDSFNFFIELRREDITIEDPFIFSSIVGACANFPALNLGKQIHCLVLVLGFESYLFVGNALIDMYAKCSDMLVARKIFDSMSIRDIVSWTSIIVGMAQHGNAKESLFLYDEMVSEGIKPNEVTFVGLMHACSHVGLVDKGRHLFKSMSKDYGLTPSLQHYTCLLDLYSRSGHLEEAENVLKSMPFEPDEAAWAALLSSCKRHRNHEMAIRIADHLMSLELKDPSTYILLSNTYASNSMWENVSKIRNLMMVKDITKEPGYSCIDLGLDLQVFYAGGTSHPLKDEIFCLLKELDEEMRRRGYVPDISEVLHDMDQIEKEKQLFWHSERVAVAYGLLKAVPGTVIRIVKNIRICGDCHTVLKFISGIVNREIIVRDANRFHHFKDEKCSCGNFW